MKQGEEFVDPTYGLSKYKMAAYPDNSEVEVLYTQAAEGVKSHLTFDRSSGDQVVTTSTTARLIPVSQIGFWPGRIQEDPRLAIVEELNGVGVSGMSEKEKIAQLELMGIYAQAGDYGEQEGFLYTSSEMNEVRFGWYSATRWNEKTFSLDVLCCIVRSVAHSDEVAYCYSVEGAKTCYDHEITCVKTKEGYFSVDMSSVEPGLYFLYEGSVVVEIV